MIPCHNCGAENPDVEVYCYQCGILLDPIFSSETHDLDTETNPVSPKRRWGTARFDLDNVLIISMQSIEAPPIRVQVNEELILGRAHEGYMPDIDFSKYNAYEMGVSRQHAVLRRTNETIVLLDLNSANSTFLNGQRLVPDQPRIVRDGDEIKLGDLVLRVNFDDGLRK